tara:strand:+ start:2435 stop:2692 length:258 start_codon:yes stop_codon:yes gene_type:complete
MKYITIKNIYHRLVAEGPTFFKKLKRVLMAIGALGVALIASQKEYAEQLAFLPTQLGGYMITIGLVGTFIASLTVSDPSGNPKVN